MRMTRGVRLLGVALLVLLLGGVDELGIGSGRFGCCGVMAQMNPNEEGDEAKQDPLQPGAEVVTADPDNFGHGGPGGAMGEVNRDGDKDGEQQDPLQPGAGEGLVNSDPRIKELEEQVMKLKSDLTEVQQRLSEKSDDLKKASDTEAQQRTLIESLQKAAQDTTADMMTLQRNYDKCTSDLQASNAEVLSLQQQLSFANTAGSVDVLRLKQEVETLQAKEKKLSDEVSLLQASNKSLNDSKNACEAERNNLEQERTRLRTEIQQLNESNDKFSQEKTQTNKVLTQLRSDYETLLRNSNKLMEEEHSQSKTTIDNLTASIKLAEDTVTTLQTAHDSLKLQYDTLAATHTDLLAEKDACDKQKLVVTQLQSDATVKQRQIDQLLQDMQARDAADAQARQKAQHRKRSDTIAGVLLGLVFPLLALLGVLLYLYCQRRRRVFHCVPASSILIDDDANVSEMYVAGTSGNPDGEQNPPNHYGMPSDMEQNPDNNF